MSEKKKTASRVSTLSACLGCGVFLLAVLSSPLTAAEEDAGRVLYRRLLEHPALRDAWGPEKAQKALEQVIRADRAWPGRVGNRGHYLSIAGSRLDGREEFLEEISLEPFPGTVLSDQRPLDRLPGIHAEPSEHDRFGRRRRAFTAYETEAPTWENDFFGVGENAVLAARALSGEDPRENFPLFYQPAEEDPSPEMEEAPVDQ